jgi:alpha-beta hydrolase superfamily lysophospholipase
MSVNQKRSSTLRILGLATLTVSAVSVSVAVGAGILAAVMARAVVTPPKRQNDDIRVLACDLDGGTVTVQATPDALLPGTYGFWFSGDSGHARLGRIVSHTGHTVTRVLESVDFGDVTRATAGRWSGWVYLGPWALGVPHQNVLIPTERGSAPAWLIPADDEWAEGEALGSDWVIQVHGRGVRRQETLRAVAAFRESGYTSLLISYRNDGDAPASADGRYGLGDTEWKDVEAALEFAREHGAQRVVLMGWSMGGAIVLQTVARAHNRALISGIVLDSPAIDWADVVAFQGRLLRLPAAIAQGAMGVMGHRWGSAVTGQQEPIQFDRLDVVTRAATLNVPILLMHSDDDGYVPSTGSRALAAARPDIVTFVPFSEARHTKLWNHDPVPWNAAITSWLASLNTSSEV